MTELEKNWNTMQTWALWALWIKQDSQKSGWQPHPHLLRGIIASSGIHFSPNAMCGVSGSPLGLLTQFLLHAQVPNWDDNWTRLLPVVGFPSWYQIHAVFNIKTQLSDSLVSTGCPSVQFNLSQQLHTTHSKLSSPTGLGHIPIKASHFRHQTQVEFPDYPHFCSPD